MKKIVLVAPMLSYPPKGGPYLRTDSSIKALHMVAELHVIARVTKKALGQAAGEKYIRQYCHSLLYCPSVQQAAVDYDSLFWSLSNNTVAREIIKWMQQFLLVEIILFFLRFFSEKSAAQLDAQFIVDYAQQQHCKIIWFTYASISVELIQQVHNLDPSLQIVADTDSVWSKFIKRGAPFQDSILRSKWLSYVASVKEKEEQRFANIATVVTAVSEVDASYYRTLTDKNKVFQFSNTIDTTQYHLTAHPDSNIVIHFAGSFGVNSPTDQAIRWFITEVFPMVHKSLKRCTLEIIGKGSKLALSDINHPAIKLQGEVESVVPYLQRATVVIVPLFFESGTRYKILEAGALKRAVVSTTLGAEGLQVTNGKELLIADDPKKFAQSVIKVATSHKLQQQLGNALHNLVTKSYGLEQHSAEAEKILKQL